MQPSYPCARTLLQCSLHTSRRMLEQYLGLPSCQPFWEVTEGRCAGSIGSATGAVHPWVSLVLCISKTGLAALPCVLQQ